MNKDAVYLTKEGFASLKEKLMHLKSVMRPEIAKKIEVAKSYGDISENFEYDIAREEEFQLEQEIVQIENALRKAEIIGKNKIDTSKVSVGSIVVVQNLTLNQENTFKIMGSLESDPLAGLISNESPIGKALLGAKKGDVVEVVTPRTTMKYEIKSIKA